MVTIPTPTFLAFSMAISIALGVTMMPRPRSESMLAVAGVSRVMRQFGLLFNSPLPYPVTYERSIFETP